MRVCLCRSRLRGMIYDSREVYDACLGSRMAEPTSTSLPRPGPKVSGADRMTIVRLRHGRNTTIPSSCLYGMPPPRLFGGSGLRARHCMDCGPRAQAAGSDRVVDYRHGPPKRIRRPHRGATYAAYHTPPRCRYGLEIESLEVCCPRARARDSTDGQRRAQPMCQINPAWGFQPIPARPALPQRGRQPFALTPKSGMGEAALSRVGGAWRPLRPRCCVQISPGRPVGGTT